MKKKTISIIFFGLIALALFQPANAALTDYALLTEITATNYLPSIIHSGDVVSVAVDIKNRGSSISITELSATIDIGNQFEAIELTDAINVIKPGATKTVLFKFKVKEETLPGYYPAFITINYLRNNESVTENQSISIPVFETKKNVDVTVEPKIINPGSQTGIVFELRNIGGTAISNVSFSWEEEDDLILPLGSDNKRYISIINPNELTQVTYIVAADPNIAPGIYSLNITLSFNDANGTRTQVSQVGLLIGGKTDFEVSAEILDSGQLSLSIANIGSNNAESVVVRIPPQNGVAIAGSSVEILGNLNKGDFTIATFELSQNRFTQSTADTSQRPTSPGMFNRFQSRASDNENSEMVERVNSNINSSELLIEIDYTDTTGERQSVEKNVFFNSGNSFGQTGNNGERGAHGFSIILLIPWALLGLIVGGALAFNKIKAKKKWKKLGIILAVITVLFVVIIAFFQSNLVAALIATIVSVGVLAWFFLKHRDK